MVSTRRDFLRAAAALPALPAMAQTRRPNIVVLLADDLGFKDVGYHGSEIQTPNIDRLAAQGARLERFYSFPVCSPTRSALMTGRSPMRLGLGYTVIRPWSDYGLPVEEQTMPAAFKSAGYQTAMSGKWHLGHAYRKFLPNSRGFDSSYGHLNGAIDYYTHIRDQGLDWHRDGKTIDDQGYSTDLIGAEAVRRIRQRDKSRPLMLYVPFNSPHAPLQAPPELIRKYSFIADERRRNYAAMVDAMDTNIGRILGAIRDGGIENETIIMFFSDNGGPVQQGANNGSLRGAKGTTFEGGIRVPACIRYPGAVKPGQVNGQVMAVWDLFPTLASAARVSPANRRPLDGIDLWPVLSGTAQAKPREDLFFSVASGKVTWTAVISREWKLVNQHPAEGGQPRSILFRIDDDPNEKSDVSQANQAIVKDLSARIEKWRATAPPDAEMPTNAPPAGFKSPARWADAAR